MGKQAMGMYVTNFDTRMDKTAYVMTYPMRPLVDTRIMNLIELNKIPSGCQVVVAIMTHSGYNQRIVSYLIKVQLKEVYFKPQFIIQLKMKIRKCMVMKKLGADLIRPRLKA